MCWAFRTSGLYRRGMPKVKVYYEDDEDDEDDVDEDDEDDEDAE